MPRLVRRKPWSERIKALLDPGDFFLWLAQELNNDAYDEWLKIWATPIGIGLNIVFILARGASRRGVARDDEVFGGEGNSNGWFAWLGTLLVQFLTLTCCLNAFYALFRRRHYRLFEQPVDVAPATPSAHRVRVDSSPASSSPLHFLRNVISSSTAASRAYPDAEREVWELGVWDPKPLNLAIFIMFSPGHLLNYYLLLPPPAMDPQPSVTVATSIAFSALLSLQLWVLKSSFIQQAKDTQLIHGEVMNEYDTKFVHPFLNQPVRDVGIQTRETATSPRGTRTREVDIYTPTTIIKRRFRTNPNPNYARQYDPDNLAAQSSEPRRSSGFSTPILEPSNYINAQTQSTYSRASPATDFSSPLKPHHERLRERSPRKGDGGSMGVHSHAASPLRKAASSNQLRAARTGLDAKQTSSGLGRMSMPGGANGNTYDPGRRRETGRL